MGLVENGSLGGSLTHVMRLSSAGPNVGRQDYKMVGSAGVEPARGRVYSSLHYRSANYPKVERDEGIAPSTSIWKTDMYLLTPIPRKVVDPKGIEPLLSECRSEVLPLSLGAHKKWSSGQESNLLI